MAIQALIDKQDNSELVRDRIAAILLAETTSQQALALAAIPPKDPNLWKLRVFTERTNPWEEWIDLPETAENPAFSAPIVNVSFDNANFDMRTGNVVERQKATGVYNVDVYGYGVSTASGSGHLAGDQAAAIECQRAVRLVRNILMSANYTYLGLARGPSQYVWRRWIQSIQLFQPQLNEHPVQQIHGARIAFQVEYNEFSPQVTGQPIEAIFVEVERAETGEVFLVAQYGEETP